MTDGYMYWHGSPQVVGLLAHLRAVFPEASELELRNHVLQYTLVKLTVWIEHSVDRDDPNDDKKEPWQ